MNNAQVGNLILQLRKEKGLTQQQLADLLNISNKTVSKWECGLGGPDVSLWLELSNILGADIQKMLEGKLEPNFPDVGKLDKVQFYVCPNCGNILTSTGKASITCCGRRQSPLKLSPHTTAPKVTCEEVDIEYYLDISHEMKREHFILFAAYVKYDRILLIRLYPEQEAQVHIPIMKGGGELYLYCTKHGLYRYTASRLNGHKFFVSF